MEKKRLIEKQTNDKTVRLGEENAVCDFDAAQLQSGSEGGPAALVKRTRGRPSRYWQKIEELKGQEAKWNLVKSTLKAPDDSAGIKAVIDKAAWSLYDDTLNTTVEVENETFTESMAKIRNNIHSEKRAVDNTPALRRKRKKSNPESVSSSEMAGVRNKSEERDIESPPSSQHDDKMSELKITGVYQTLIESGLSPVSSVIQNVQNSQSLLAPTLSEAKLSSALPTTSYLSLPQPISSVIAPSAKIESPSVKRPSSGELMAKALSNVHPRIMPRAKVSDDLVNVNVAKHMALKQQLRDIQDIPRDQIPPKSSVIVITPNQTGLPESNRAARYIEVGETIYSLDEVWRDLKVSSYQELLDKLIDSYKSNRPAKDESSGEAESTKPSKKPQSTKAKNPTSVWTDGPIVHIPYRVQTTAGGDSRLQPLANILDLNVLKPHLKHTDIIARPCGGGRLLLEPLFMGNCYQSDKAAGGAKGEAPKQPQSEASQDSMDKIEVSISPEAVGTITMQPPLQMAVFPGFEIKKEAEDSYGVKDYGNGETMELEAEVNQDSDTD